MRRFPGAVQAARRELPRGGPSEEVAPGEAADRDLLAAGERTTGPRATVPRSLGFTELVLSPATQPVTDNQAGGRRAEHPP
jgi:hypothetical protein